MVSGLPQKCAGDVLDTIPLIVRFFHTHMRKQPVSDLSLPQFRVLGYLHFHDRAMLSAAAEHIGVARPSMSRMIDGLVARGLVSRATRSADRRQVALGLTARGRAMLQAARAAAQRRLAQELSGVPPRDLATVRQAMAALRGALDPKKLGPGR